MAECPRCQAKVNPEAWFRLVERELKRGFDLDYGDCYNCGTPQPEFGSKQFIHRQVIFNEWLRLHHRELPPWLMPAYVAVLLSHQGAVDKYWKHLAGFE